MSDFSAKPEFRRTLMAMAMRRILALATAAAGTAGCLALEPAPSYAAGSAGSRLVLTIAAGEKAKPVQHRVTLTCSPAGGTHKQAKAACAALNAAKGDPAAITNDGSMCMMIYDPVTVTANGRWKGKAVRFTHTYGNPCVLHAATGAVFAF
jgi:Subtilisin inhibitor-like